jgi:hypothetical protein
LNPEQLLLEHSTIIPPIDLFEISGTQEILVRRLVSRWEDIAERNGIRKQDAIKILLDLLYSVPKPECFANGSLIFYGSAVYADETYIIKDFDVARFVLGMAPVFSNPAEPNLHVCELRHLNEFGVNLLNTVVLFSYSDAVNEIKSARKRFFESRDPSNNIDIVLAYAFMKILEGKGEKFQRRLGVLDADLGESGRELSPSELSVQIMLRASKFSEKELKDLAKSAFRRIRIKEEKIEELTNRFKERALKLRTG